MQGEKREQGVKRFKDIIKYHKNARYNKRRLSCRRKLKQKDKEIIIITECEGKGENDTSKVSEKGRSERRKCGNKR